MPAFSRRSLVPAACKSIGALIAIVPLVVGAQITKPSLAGPSTAKVAHDSTFRGFGFSPNAPLSFAVLTPGGGEAHFGAVAGPDGSVSYTLRPAVAGAHTLKVLDSSGRTLASVGIHAAP